MSGKIPWEKKWSWHIFHGTLSVVSTQPRCRQRCPHHRGGKGKGKDNKHVFSPTFSAPFSRLFPSAGISHGSLTRGEQCHVTTSLWSSSWALWTPPGMQWEGHNPTCVTHRKPQTPRFFLPHANELPISCFHHSLPSDVTNFQDRQEDARLTASTDAGTQRSSHPCSRAGDPNTTQPKWAWSISQTSQQQLCSQHDVSEHSPSTIPPSPPLWPSPHPAGICLLLAQPGEHLGHCITSTPFESFSECFHNTRGRQDSNQALQSQIRVFPWQKPSQNPGRGQRTQENVGATSEHRPCAQQTLCKILFWGFHSETQIKQTKIQHRLKFKDILKSLLAQGLKQGLRATHHITFNWATVFPYGFPWGDQWLAYEFK